jgi:hypothetical protein
MLKITQSFGSMLRMKAKKAWIYTRCGRIMYNRNTLPALKFDFAFIFKKRIKLTGKKNRNACKETEF